MLSTCWFFVDFRLDSDSEIKSESKWRVTPFLGVKKIVKFVSNPILLQSSNPFGSAKSAPSGGDSCVANGWQPGDLDDKKGDCYHTEGHISTSIIRIFGT